jgi:chromosome segregation ATPase
VKSSIRARCCCALRKSRTPENSLPQRCGVEIESARADCFANGIAERVREIARQLETTLERLSQQAEGLAREGDRAASQHAERKLEAERFARELGDARARVAKLQAERETLSMRLFVDTKPSATLKPN